MMKKYLSLTLLISIALLLLTIYPSYQLSLRYGLQSVSNSTIATKGWQFPQAIDAATGVYIRTQEWRTYLNTFTNSFPVPDCEPPSFPSVFNFSSTVLNLCYESNALYPWNLIHIKAGNMLVDTLKKHYGIELTANFVLINTQTGYFTSLKKAVDDGSCDVAIASTNIDSTRTTQAHFQCAYGSSYNAYIRSELDPNIRVENETGLNQPGIKVAVYKTTTYDAWATANLPLATIIRFSGGYYEAWPMILDKQVHAVITDAVDLLSWLSTNKGNCSTCKVGLFGDVFTYGSFVSNQYDVRISGTISLLEMQNALLFILSCLATIFLL